MDGVTVLLRGTILTATIIWAWAEVLKIRRPADVEPARRLWTAALALALVHAAIAFDAVHGWSHADAFASTARQTAAVTGLSWGGGIFVNYLFLASWLADAVWWWVAPVAYRRRHLTLERARLAFFVFMFINGAVIFAGSAGRGVGVPAIAAVCLTWMRESRSRPAHA